MKKYRMKQILPTCEYCSWRSFCQQLTNHFINDDPKCKRFESIFDQKISNSINAEPISEINSITDTN